MAAPLIWVNGFPGAGKLTVARELGALDESFKIIDNHQLIDPVEARFSRSQPEYQPARKQERQRAFAQWVLSEQHLARTIVFTDFQSTTDGGPEVAQEYEEAARQAGRRFLPVYLSCDPRANLERAQSDERCNGGTTKLTDAAILKSILKREVAFRFEGHPGLDVDTTHKAPAEVAQEILDFSKKHSV
ncbi:hypothetical protein F5X68DRAFT_36291 [Plectosphaerella plurivora]|uniref:Uncharacterized protein n=1 Tax=Plectosphaerella plurivora TaxID=936078 RepID=A0A9P9A5Q8_9PEZI|nr:hypothetical protein F5X68DRAFT_36291 [Plectosphaerella plurivora]